MPSDHDQARASETEQALAAQAALSPYALLAFVVCAPIFLWAGSHAPRPGQLVPGLAAFALALAASYAVTAWLRSPQAQDLTRRGRAHLLTGLIWAGAVAVLSGFAAHAGPAREPLMALALGAAMLTAVFAAPWLPSLLIVAPAAAAGPLIGFMTSSVDGARQAAAGVVALTLAVALIFNRVLRRQFALATERETLMRDRAAKIDEADRLARSKSDLIATLSHEIRNGLTGVAHVLSAAAGRSGRGAPSREQLTAALDAANDLITVLNTTLDSETAENGRLAVESRPIDPVALMRDLVLLHRPAAAAKGLELALHVDPALAARSTGALAADPARTRQVVANLIGNALKFTVRGRVEARLELEGDNRLAIEIADTGPGLSEAELAEAFTPFQRVTRTSVGAPGAGLGLPLARRLAELMGGALHARSAPGVGSCFRLTLPYDPTAPLEAAVEPSVAAPTPAEPRSLKILIAEDDSLNAAMLRAVLEQLGHQVVHAVDGRRAVELAKGYPFELMMIDGRMPHLDGPDAIAAIRALPGAPGQGAIVAVTGGDADEAQDCIAAGADAVLRKPVAVTAVARVIAQALEMDRAARAAMRVA